MTTSRMVLALVCCAAASVAAQRPSSRSSQAAAAERALNHGDLAQADRLALAITTPYEESGTGWSAPDRIAAGRAYVILGLHSPNAVRSALKAFDSAVAADPRNVDARLRTGALFLDKYNAPDAEASFRDVLKIDSANARAQLGLAKVLAFEGKRDGIKYARAAATSDPRLADAHIFLARFHLEAESYDSATMEARAAIAADSESIAAWGALGAAAMLRGDSAGYQRAKLGAEHINPKPAAFYMDLADAVEHQRRYDEGIRLARQALEMDSTSARALGLLGTNEMRAGNLDRARPLLERAFAIDPFNLWHKNTLDLLDQMRGFVSVDSGHFHIVAPAAESRVLTPYLLPLLEEAYDSLSRRYHYTPPVRVRLEIFSRHADFSVRTLGLTGLGALGVSFGPVLVIDAPSARARNEFNWGSTAWHELAHTFTLGLSNNKAPRWFSEGLSVLEERHARPEWGADASVEFLAVYLGGKIRPVSQLNDGFVQPRYGAEVVFSYYDASLVCEMIERDFGSKAIVDMLLAYRDGLSTPQVFAKVLKLTPEQMDQRYDAWFRARFATPLAHIEASTDESNIGGDFVSSMRKAIELLQRNQVDSARALLLVAQGMFPTYAGPDAPALMLARLDKKESDLRGTLAEVQRVTQRNETAWDANLLEAELRLQLGDSAGALLPLQRLIWISPYDVAVHVRIAELAAKVHQPALAVRERRAVISLDPTDLLEARYQLARALADAGDIKAARTELLNTLENAPQFEKAQALLLELTTRSASSP